MTAWPHIIWSQAQQVIDRVGWPVTLPATVLPDAYFTQLRDDGRLVDALLYLAHALSRHDAIGWTVACLGDFGLDPADPVARAATAWLDDASDARRWLAEELGAQAPPGSAGQLLASAIFFSGGTIADDTQDPLMPPPETCGRFAACAIIQGATQGEDFERRILHALDRGEAIARGPGRGQ